MTSMSAYTGKSTEQGARKRDGFSLFPASSRDRTSAVRPVAEAGREADMRRLAAVAGLAALLGAYSAAALAEPARIILLRHAEKKNSRDLCDVGQLRAQALSDQYLGKGAPGNETIYGKGGRPDAFFAITAHTQETATPAAESWGMEPIIFPVPPKDPDEESDLDTQTRKAATALASASYDGKIVVVVWEHKRIANKELNQDGKTLWALLKLGEIPNVDVPQTWKGANYDYFWIIDHQNPQPTFRIIQQEYPADAYAEVPNNPWGEDVDQSRYPEFYAACKQ